MTAWGVGDRMCGWLWAAGPRGGLRAGSPAGRSAAVPTHSGRRASLLLTAALVTLLAGCVNVGKAPPLARSVFDFGPPVPALDAATGGLSLGLDLRAPAWLDQSAQIYRLAYDNPQQLREYAQSRWAGAPSQLVAQRLRQRLALPAAGGRCGLQGQMEEFSQMFDSTTQSRGILRLTLRLLDRQGTLLAATPVAVEVMATSADARGGAAALAVATDRAAEATASWLRGLGSAGTLRNCAG